MAQIEWVPAIDQYYQGQGFPGYKWSKFDSSPWTPFEKPLDKACIALLSSSGVFKDDQEPFDPWAVNDYSHRQIPKDTPLEKLKLHHNYFDHRNALKDLNCVFPLQRLNELEAVGFIGNLASVTITLGMGRLYKRSGLADQTIPAVVEVLKREGVDAALLVAA
jgi:D-proline reductase (dithiol) PrdB